MGEGVGGSGPAAPSWTALGLGLHDTEFVQLPIASILNSPQQGGLSFWSLNPYVGCEFGCSYCFARYVHRYVAERAHGRGAAESPGPPCAGGASGRDDFERRIFVKGQAPDVLGLTLRPARLRGASIAIGTATDPYQPAERRFRVTRQVLERLAQLHGLTVELVTKSPLVVRDVDVLRRLAERNEVTVHFSLIAADVPLVRRLEPRSPVPPLRLAALRKLRRAGIRAGVMAAPVLPGITDGVPQLRALVAAAKEAGAASFHASPLRLYAGVRQRFLPVLARAFPALPARYERAFDSSGDIGPAYRAALERRVERIRRELGFEEKEGTGAQAHGGTDTWARGPIQWELPL